MRFALSFSGLYLSAALLTATGNPEVKPVLRALRLDNAPRAIAADHVIPDARVSCLLTWSTPSPASRKLIPLLEKIQVRHARDGLKIATLYRGKDINVAVNHLAASGGAALENYVVEPRGEAPDDVYLIIKRGDRQTILIWHPPDEDVSMVSGLIRERLKN